MNDAELIEDAAARWLMRREDPHWSEANEEQLAAWLDKSMAHKAAYWRLRHGWREADRITALGDAIITHTEHRLLPRRSARISPWLSGVAALAASAALVLGLGTATWRHFAPSTENHATLAYSTPIGGRQTLALDDGSRIELNTATVIRVATRPQAREAWLDRGEAFFDIAHNPDHRFVVHAGPRTITVLGTRFSVRRDGDEVTVAVISGRVRVDDATAGAGTKAGARAAIVSKGDLAVAQANATLVAISAPAQVEAMTAWRDGRLVFDHETLAGAVAEFNRYSTRPIRIVDPAVGEMRIGGSFQIRNSEGFLDLLQSAYGLEVTATADEIEIDR